MSLMGTSRTSDGAFVVAGLKDNKAFRIDRAGRVSMVLDQFQGKPLGTVNTAWADTPRPDMGVDDDAPGTLVSGAQHQAGRLHTVDRARASANCR